MNAHNHNVASSESAFNPFARLSDVQRERLRAYEQHLRRFNQKINLISPDTEPHIRERHILHCLALTWRGFLAGSRVVDWGTGGGLPAIPLAIAYPDVTVIAVDSVGKKVRAVRAMARRLDLENLFAWEGRAEQWPGPAHYSVSRATAPLIDLWYWHERIAAPPESGRPVDAWPPGLLCLKGGELTEEIDALRSENPSVRVEQYPLRPLLERDYFADKYLLSAHQS